jgi:hypothetical protein
MKNGLWNLQAHEKEESSSLVYPFTLIGFTTERGRVLYDAIVQSIKTTDYTPSPKDKATELLPAALNVLCYSSLTAKDDETKILLPPGSVFCMDFHGDSLINPTQRLCDLQTLLDIWEGSQSHADIYIILEDVQNKILRDKQTELTQLISQMVATSNFSRPRTRFKV